jgi:hypothetical protein
MCPQNRAQMFSIKIKQQILKNSTLKAFTVIGWESALSIP